MAISGGGNHAKPNLLKIRDINLKAKMILVSALLLPSLAIAVQPFDAHQITEKSKEILNTPDKVIWLKIEDQRLTGNKVTMEVLGIKDGSYVLRTCDSFRQELSCTEQEISDKEGVYLEFNKGVKEKSALFGNEHDPL